MPHINATWSWGKESWHVSMRQGLTADSSFIPYSEVVAAQIEERFSAWKVGTASPTCTLEIGERNLAGGTVGVTFAKRLGLSKVCKVVIDFDAMTQTDVLTGSSRPI